MEKNLLEIAIVAGAWITCYVLQRLLGNKYPHLKAPQFILIIGLATTSVVMTVNFATATPGEIDFFEKFLLSAAIGFLSTFISAILNAIVSVRQKSLEKRKNEKDELKALLKEVQEPLTNAIDALTKALLEQNDSALNNQSKIIESELRQNFQNHLGATFNELNENVKIFSGCLKDFMESTEKAQTYFKNIGADCSKLQEFHNQNYLLTQNAEQLTSKIISAADVLEGKEKKITELINESWAHHKELGEQVFEGLVSAKNKITEWANSATNDVQITRSSIQKFHEECEESMNITASMVANMSTAVKNNVIETKKMQLECQVEVANESV